MNYSNFSREQLINLVDHLKTNFIPDNVLFKSHSLVTVEKLSESVRSLQNDIKTLNIELDSLRKENHNLKQEILSRSSTKTNNNKTVKKSK